MVGDGEAISDYFCATDDVRTHEGVLQGCAGASASVSLRREGSGGREGSIDNVRVPNMRVTNTARERSLRDLTERELGGGERLGGRTPNAKRTSISPSSVLRGQSEAGGTHTHTHTHAGIAGGGAVVSGVWRRELGRVSSEMSVAGSGGGERGRWKREKHVTVDDILIEGLFSFRVYACLYLCLCLCL